MARRSCSTSFSSACASDCSRAQLIVACPQFRLDFRERLRPALARAGESPHVTRVFRLELTQSRGFRGDPFAQQFQVREVLGDGSDALGAGAAEIAVVGHHASGGRRVALVEQQFQLLLPPVHVGNLQLRGERAALVRNFALRLCLLGLQPRELLLGIDAAGTHLGQPLARRLDLQVRVLELARESVAALRVRMDLLANGLDARAHLPELGFLGVDAGRRGLKGDRAQQQYISGGGRNGRANASCASSRALPQSRRHVPNGAAAILRDLLGDLWAARCRRPAQWRRRVAYSVQ